MKNYSYFLCALLVASCSKTPEIIIDPNTVTDPVKVVEDKLECTEIADNVNKTGEGMTKTVAGAAIGGVAVAGIATAVAGAVFLPAVPFIIAGGATGGSLWGNSVKEKERKIKEKIIVDCMIDRGYRVYSSSS